MRRHLAGFAVLLVACASGAQANDSTATLGADGLQLTETADIAMESEDLFISAKEIKVRYSFRNVSDQPIETVVAFPLPEIDWSKLNEVPIDHPSADGVNFVDFSVTVDGAPVTPQLEQRAFFKGADVTDEVTRLKLPMTMFEPDYYEKLMAVAKPDRRALEAKELALFEDEYESAYPQWLTQTRFHWTQTFPPGRPVVVEHTYKPVVGRFAVDYVIDSQYEDDPRQPERFCLDTATEKAIRDRKAAESTAEQPAYLDSEWVQYILTTANNWRGPIGKFHLTIDKGAPDAIVATCVEGLKETGPTTLEFEATDFAPQRDIDLLLVHHHQPE